MAPSLPLPASLSFPRQAPGQASSWCPPGRWVGRWEGWRHTLCPLEPTALPRLPDSLPLCPFTSVSRLSASRAPALARPGGWQRVLRPGPRAQARGVCAQEGWGPAPAPSCVYSSEENSSSPGYFGKLICTWVSVYSWPWAALQVNAGHCGRGSGPSPSQATSIHPSVSHPDQAWGPTDMHSKSPSTDEGVKQPGRAHRARPGTPPTRPGSKFCSLEPSHLRGPSLLIWEMGEKGAGQRAHAGAKRHRPRDPSPWGRRSKAQAICK